MCWRHGDKTRFLLSWCCQDDEQSVEKRAFQNHAGQAAQVTGMAESSIPYPGLYSQQVCAGDMGTEPFPPPASLSPHGGYIRYSWMDLLLWKSYAPAWLSNFQDSFFTSNRITVCFFLFFQNYAPLCGMGDIIYFLYPQDLNPWIILNLAQAWHHK